MTIRSLPALFFAATLLLGIAAPGGWTPALAQDRDDVPLLLQDYVPVTDEMLRNPDPEDWLTFRGGYRLWGYSPLDRIDTDTVGGLQLAWSRSMSEGYQEVEPIVHDGVMFFPHVEDRVEAVDATTGDLLWEYRRFTPDEPWNTTGTRARYRNVSIYDDKVYVATNDAFLVALDARTGELVWESQRADWREQVAQTTGPIIVDGMVVTGSRCNPSSPRPGGCFITGHDPQTGEERWRVNTAATPDQAGGDTWEASRARPPPHLRLDAGELRPRAGPRLLGHRAAVAAAGAAARFGQGRPAVHQLDARPRSADRRAGLVLPAPAARQLGPRPCLRAVDRRDRGVAGSRRGALDQSGAGAGRDPQGDHRHSGKTGLVWTLDAATGEFLWARPTVYQNIMTGLDVRTGRPIIDESTTPWSVTDPVLACRTCSAARTSRRRLQSGHRRDVHADEQRLHGSVDVGGGGGPERRLRRPRRRAPPSAVDADTTPVGRLEAISASTAARSALPAGAPDLRIGPRHRRQPGLLRRHRPPLPRLPRRTATSSGRPS